MANAALAAATFFSAIALGNLARIAAMMESSWSCPVAAANAPSNGTFGTARPTCFSASSVAGSSVNR